MIDRTILNKWSWMPHICPFNPTCAICTYGWIKWRKQKEIKDGHNSNQPTIERCETID